MSNNNLNLIAKKIKKEHFIKLTLWISGIFVLCLWLSMVLATAINDYSTPIFEVENGKEVVYLHSQLQKDFEYSFRGPDTFWKIIGSKPNNPIWLMGNSEGIGWWVAIFVAPLGFLALIFLLAFQKNMITPQAIIKTVRKALTFGYLKQKDTDYIEEEVWINIGVKERKEDNEKMI